MKNIAVVFEQDNKQIIQQGSHFFTRVTENGEVFESADFNTLERAKASLSILPTIEENNKLIAEFLGYETYKMNGVLNVEYSENNIRTIQDTHYHIDWNWLMEVVEKIESLGYDVFINTNICRITDVGQNIFEDIECFVNNNKRQAVYNACVEFVKWYNGQKKY